MARTKQPPRKAVGRKAPRASSSGPASFATIWNIAEVAERILSHLPMKDLLLAQRVSSGWRDLITTSPTLQVLLFMRPRQSYAAEATHADGSPVREFNPLLLEHMPLWFSLRAHKEIFRPTVKDLAWAQTSARLIYLRRDASWRRKLLAQPPFTIFESVQNVNFFGGDSITIGSIVQDNGVRMGLAYDQAVEPVETGSRSIPNFYTLMDGRISHDPEPTSASDPSARSSERLFGGLNTFTLFSGTTLGCCYDPDAELENEIEMRQFTSDGSQGVRVDRTALSGEGYSWWTKDGYRRLKWTESEILSILE